MLGVIGVAIGSHRKQRVALGEGAPQRAPLTGGAPAGLVHVQRPRASHAREQVRVRICQRLAGTGEDRIEGPR